MESKGNLKALQQKLLRKMWSEAENTVKVKVVVQLHGDDTLVSTRAAGRY